MFQQLLLHPAHADFFCFNHARTHYRPQRAQFGIASLPAFASLISGETARILQAAGIRCCVMLDDFLLAASTREACVAAIATALDILASLGWVVNPNKVEGPAQELDFIGIVIDTVALTVHAKPSLVRSSLDSIAALLTCAKIDKPKLEQLLGKLGWITSLVPRGKPYLMEGYKALQRYTYFSILNRSDLAWWTRVLSIALSPRPRAAQPFRQRFWPAVPLARLARSPHPLASPLRVVSDASGVHGFGILSAEVGPQGWFDHPERYSSTRLELEPFVLFLEQEAPRLQHRVVVLTSDNLGLVWDI